MQRGLVCERFVDGNTGLMFVSGDVDCSFMLKSWVFYIVEISSPVLIPMC